MSDVTIAATMPLVWTSAAKHGVIAGFSNADFVLYYLSILMMGCFITSHFMWDLAEEIKNGAFSTALLRPIGIYEVTFLRNLAWRLIRTSLFLPIFIAMLYCYRGFLGSATVHLTPVFWTSLFAGHFVSFFFMMFMGSIALYVEEVHSIFELQYVPLLFLSGQMFPVALMPKWASSLAHVLPFYYTTGVPTEILVGRLDLTDGWRCVGIQFLWIAICAVVGRWSWRRGLRSYSGVGM